MSLLEELIGQPLDVVTDDELREFTIYGRTARELESADAKMKRRKSAEGGGSKSKRVLDFDPDDFE